MSLLDVHHHNSTGVDLSMTCGKLIREGLNLYIDFIIYSDFLFI